MTDAYPLPDPYPLVARDRGLSSESLCKLFDGESELLNFDMDLDDLSVANIDAPLPRATNIDMTLPNFDRARGNWDIVSDTSEPNEAGALLDETTRTVNGRMADYRVTDTPLQGSLNRNNDGLKQPTMFGTKGVRVAKVACSLRLPHNYRDYLETVGCLTLDESIATEQNNSIWHPHARLDGSYCLANEQVKSINRLILAMEKTHLSLQDVKDTDKVAYAFRTETKQLIEGMNMIGAKENIDPTGQSRERPVKNIKVEWPLDFFIHRFQRSVENIIDGDIDLAFRRDETAQESFCWLVQALRTIVVVYL